jgi:hypothetical protein
MLIKMSWIVSAQIAVLYFEILKKYKCKQLVKLLIMDWENEKFDRLMVKYGLVILFVIK